MSKTNKIAFVAIILFVLMMGVIFVYPKITGSSTTEDIQKITLSYKNYNYYPNEIKVKANQPVEITLDSTVGGCYRAFIIPEFGISQYSKDPSQKIAFTPTKTGSFEFACSMKMGTGTIIVE